ncbi:MAG TPA: chemotaxis protein CheA [Marinobacter sp.]|nr:chemotaxis protein CheA [Marinobacter sp.]
MSFDGDEEILQDFLVEAGEILELLSEQLVDLEQNPDDSNLLNAIFRGFHTVKGGAGFLQLDALVNCCHSAENVFDTLRNHKRKVTSELMDVVLETLDNVNAMFEEVRQREALTPAPQELIERLDQLALPESDAAIPPAAPASASVSADQGDITDDEFEQLLDALNSDETAPAAADATSVDNPVASGNGDINDDEFEALLDQLHGKGGSPTAGAEAAAAPVKKPEAAKVSAAAKAPVEPAPTKAPAREAAPAASETSVRVDTKRLDDIMNMVGELVLVRNRLQRLGDQSEDEQMHKAVANLDVVTTDLQAAVMQTRMQPIKKVFGRFPRVVRDLARSLKKEINLVMHGEDTDLDKNLVEALSDPLVHLVRNSVDHGIEGPEERERAGKPRTGTITLSAEQEGDHILLLITDDGAGMNADVLRRTAVEKGMYDQDGADRLTDQECYNLIFAAGFSTKDQISDVSGRGVGMDVVKTKISQLNGQLSVVSKLGEGSSIVIKVPLTLAIMPTLMIMLADQSFALPLVNVVEIFHLNLSKTNVVDGRECVVVRDKVFPLFHIKRWLIRGGAGHVEPENGHVVIVSMGTRQVGFVVDQLVGQEEVVIKPLGRGLLGTPGMAGATITGDGRIALIIDVPSLLQHYS